MKQLVSLLLAVGLNLSVLNCISGQTPQSQDDVVRVRTTEVKLDIVVKDKKGRPVKDLTAADFEVMEDGVGQKIQSFTFVNREPSTPASTVPDTIADRKEGKPPETASNPTTPARTRTTPGITALVFDRLSPEARSLAKKAGLAYAQEGMAGGDYTGVFRIDQSLNTIQPFTDNMELLRVAVDNATSATGSTYASTAQRGRDIADRSLALDSQIASSVSAAAGAGVYAVARLRRGLDLLGRADRPLA